MPFDAAEYVRGYRARQKSARLNAGLPAPDLQWPRNLYGNEIDPRELMGESARPPKTIIGSRLLAHMVGVTAAAGFQATEPSLRSSTKPGSVECARRSSTSAPCPAAWHGEGRMSHEPYGLTDLLQHDRA